MAGGEAVRGLFLAVCVRKGAEGEGGRRAQEAQRVGACARLPDAPRPARLRAAEPPREVGPARNVPHDVRRLERRPLGAAVRRAAAAAARAVGGHREGARRGVPPEDPRLGDDSGDEVRRRHVEGGVPHADPRRGDLLPLKVGDLLGGALLDHDAGARRGGRVERGARGGDVKGGPVVARGHGVAVRAWGSPGVWRGRAFRWRAPSGANLGKGRPCGVPILLAVSPFAATRSAPTMTASIFPEDLSTMTHEHDTQSCVFAKCQARPPMSLGRSARPYAGPAAISDAAALSVMSEAGMSESWTSSKAVSRAPCADVRMRYRNLVCGGMRGPAWDCGAPCWRPAGLLGARA